MKGGAGGSSQRLTLRRQRATEQVTRRLSEHCGEESGAVVRWCGSVSKQMWLTCRETMMNDAMARGRSSGHSYDLPHQRR
jgi:hypothetical protein